jgi:hypothetical protein
MGYKRMWMLYDFSTKAAFKAHPVIPFESSLHLRQRKSAQRSAVEAPILLYSHLLRDQIIHYAHYPQLCRLLTSNLVQKDLEKGLQQLLSKSVGNHHIPVNRHL